MPTGVAKKLGRSPCYAARFLSSRTGIFVSAEPAQFMSPDPSFRGMPGAPAYCASKAAVRIYGEALRGEMAPRGVEVNVICPGFIKTPMTDVNPFPMPMLMPPKQAARIIRKGLERNQARIAFPRPIYLLTRALASLPQPIMDWIAARLPRK